MLCQENYVFFIFQSTVVVQQTQPVVVHKSSVSMQKINRVKIQLVNHINSI